MRQLGRQQVVELEQLERARQTAASSGNTIQTNPANSGKTVTIGSKNFTEEFILGQIYAQALKAAGYNVKTQLNLGSEQIALKALKSGQVDAYPEYTGTALTSFFKMKATDVPHDEQQAYELAKTDFAKEGLTALPPTPFTDSNGVGMLKAKAEQLGITKISDLTDKALEADVLGHARVPAAAGLPARAEGRLRPEVQEGHGGRPVAAPHGARQGPGRRLDRLHDRRPARPGQGDCCSRTTSTCSRPTTSRSCSSRRRSSKLGPDAQKTIELVQKGLTTEAMQELNSRVDIDKQTPAQVAKDYLTESGYLK